MGDFPDADRGTSAGGIEGYGDKSLKKTKRFARPVNETYLKELEEKKENEEKQTVDIVICNALAAEMEEMGSFYHDKSHQVWLWRAVDHATDTPLAYVFGTREHKYLEELLKLPELFSIGTVYADNHFACSNKVADNQLVTGKKNTQRMEQDHLTLRTHIKRLARKTICFSWDKELHMAVIGTFINLFFFHRPSMLQFYYEGAFKKAARPAQASRSPKFPGSTFTV